VGAGKGLDAGYATATAGLGAVAVPVHLRPAREAALLAVDVPLDDVVELEALRARGPRVETGTVPGGGGGEEDREGLG
jgi:hypothetical protein